MKTLLGIALSFALAQLAASPQAGMASVEGRVIRSGSNDAIAEVAVELIRSGSPGVQVPSGPEQPPLPALAQRSAAPRLLATTGDDGRFSIQSVPPGEYRLYATHPNGYVPAEYGQRSVTGIGLPIAFTAGQKMMDVTLSMARTASISGRVTDGDGDPAVFSSILAFRIAYRTDGERKVEIVQSVLTDDRGEFRIFWLAPGKYYLSAMPIETRQYGLPLSFAGRFGGAQYLATPMLGYRTLESGEVVEETWAPIYYPGVSDIRSARQLTLGQGEHFDASLSVAASPTRTLQVRGVVLNPSGQPLANAQINLSPRRSDGHSVVLPTASTDAAGAFTIRGVGAGSYLMFVRGEPGSGGGRTRVPSPGEVLDVRQILPASTAVLSLDVGASDIANLRIQTLPDVSIPWRTTFEARPEGNASPPSLSVSLVRDPNIAGVPSPMGGAGPTMLESVGMGDYRVNISNLPKNAYVKSIRMGGADVLKDGLHITGSAPDTLEIVVGANGGVLDGVILAGRERTVSSAAVVLLPELTQRQNRLDLFKTSVSNFDGKFHFDGIAPGDYRIFAWEDVRPNDWYDADFMRDYEFRGVTVRIAESDSKNIEVPVIPVDQGAR